MLLIKTNQHPFSKLMQSSTQPASDLSSPISNDYFDCPLCMTHKLTKHTYIKVPLAAAPVWYYLAAGASPVCGCLTGLVFQSFNRDKIESCHNLKCASKNNPLIHQ